MTKIRQQHVSLFRIGWCMALLFIVSINNGQVSVDAIKKNDNNDGCICPNMLPPRPDLWKKAETARWMVHAIEWGVLSTISSRQDGIMPFGNVYSFIDGSCQNSTGKPYFYGTYMDQSFQDMQANPVASFTLSEASLLSSSCYHDDDGFVERACSIHHNHQQHVGDPENPVCARLTLSGTLEEVSSDNDEYQFIRNAFFQRHPQMETWPTDHNWVIVKLNIEEIWLIDYFGGATVLTPETYYSVDIMNTNIDHQMVDE